MSTEDPLKSTQPLVSVIIPAYNGASLLTEAVESILAQHYTSLEIIIVDDGSTDNTAEVVASLEGNIRYFYQPNRGLPATRNQGLVLAQGELITFLDVDDLWSQNKLELQLGLLRQHPEAEIVLGHTQLMQSHIDTAGRRTFEAWSTPRLAMSMGAGLFRRALFERAGAFDESQRYCDDLAWFMRAREMGISTLVHPEVTLYYRRHESNMTNEVELGNRFLLKMLKDSLDRRRQGNQTDISLPPLATAPENADSPESG